MVQFTYRVRLALVAVLLCFGYLPHARAQYNEANVSYNDFYEDLALYGQWLDDPQYGYVWLPDEDGSFRPYFSNGYWIMTDFGNTWVSNYPWGWACFHYGRWTYDSYYGWLWVPGTSWGPAWVAWRYNEGNFGWAPMAPGQEVSMKTNDFTCPNDWWVFVPGAYIYAGDYYRYWWGPRENRALVGKTMLLNNVLMNNNAAYVAGPHLQQVQKATKGPVQVFKVHNSNSLNMRVQGNTLHIFRPAEVRPVTNAGGGRVSPPNAITAPHPIKKSLTINSSRDIIPEFRRDVPRTSNHAFPVGTRAMETAVPEPKKPRKEVRPYEWDTRQSVPQPPHEPKPVPAAPAPSTKRPPAQPAKPKQGKGQTQTPEPPAVQKQAPPVPAQKADAPKNAEPKQPKEKPERE